MPRPKNIWNEREADLRRLAAEGKTLRQIAAVYGATYQRVGLVMQQLAIKTTGAEGRHPSFVGRKASGPRSPYEGVWKEREAELLRLAADGHTVRQIAAIYSVSSGRIGQVLLRMGIKRTPPEKPPRPAKPKRGEITVPPTAAGQLIECSARCGPTEWELAIRGGMATKRVHFSREHCPILINLDGVEYYLTVDKASFWHPQGSHIKGKRVQEWMMKHSLQPGQCVYLQVIEPFREFRALEARPHVP